MCFKYSVHHLMGAVEMTDIIEDIEDNNIRRTVLQEYYARYLTEIRGSSASTVKHYIDALNNISRKLKAMEIVSSDIYEIMDLKELADARRKLFADPAFIAQDTRGRRMYSAGLNNYYRFASGEDFADKTAIGDKSRMDVMDIPIVPSLSQKVTRVEWSRTNILREQALASAGYACEIDKEHWSFIAERTNRAYMEGHHAIPMNNQPKFENSLDVYANIVCLCPICHRKIHYGIKNDRIQMMHILYSMRADRLANSGICLSMDEFVSFAWQDT